MRSRHYDGHVQRAYLASTRALSALLVVVGAAMVVSTLVRGAGLALGVVLGTMLVAIGAGRLWLGRGDRSGQPQP